MRRAPRQRVMPLGVDEALQVAQVRATSGQIGRRLGLREVAQRIVERSDVDCRQRSKSKPFCGLGSVRAAEQIVGPEEARIVVLDDQRRRDLDRGIDYG